MASHRAPVVVLAFGLAACSSVPPAAAPTISTPHEASAAPAPSRLVTSVASALRAAARKAAVPITLEPVLETPPPAPLMPPNGATCYLRGTGDPFASGCEGDLLAVTARKDGSMPLAGFDARSIDITWAFFEGRGYPWVGVRSGGLTLTGFAISDKTRFKLVREIPAVEGHIWFEPGATIRVRGGKGRGIDLSVEGDSMGVESIVGNAPCDAISFDLAPKLTPSTERAPATEMAVPARTILPLRLTPGGPVVAALRDAKGPPGIFLDVLDKRAGFTRIGFDTTSARFDVWVGDRDIRPDAGDVAFGVGGLGICGGTSDFGAMTTSEALADTRVIVAKSPKEGSGPDGLTLTQGSSVVIRSTKDGFAEVDPAFSTIRPPPGLSFWVPETALRPRVSRRY